MPLPLTTIFLVAAVIFGFAFHQEDVTVIWLALACLNELIRLYALRGAVRNEPVQTQKGDTVLIPNRERTPIGGNDGEE